MAPALWYKFASVTEEHIASSFGGEGIGYTNICNAVLVDDICIEIGETVRKVYDMILYICQLQLG